MIFQGQISPVDIKFEFAIFLQRSVKQQLSTIRLQIGLPQEVNKAALIVFKKYVYKK